MNRKIVSISFVILTVALLALLFTSIHAQAFNHKINVLETKSAVYSPFIDVNIKAKSVIVYDKTADKILYEKNSNTTFALASVTKVASAIVVQEDINTGDEITIKNTDLVVEGNNGLILGEKWGRDELNSFSLVVSSNDGITALARHFENQNETSFVGRMNERMLELGINDVAFVNPTGLDENEYLAGAYGTAYGVAKLSEFFMDNFKEMAQRTTIKEGQFFSQNGIAYEASNTNIALADIPNAIFSKTGFTDIAGGNVVTAFSPNGVNEIIIVILGSSKEDRFVDLLELVDRAQIMYGVKNT